MNFHKLTSSMAVIGLLVSSSSFAAHAFRTEECKSSTFEIEYQGSYAVGGDYAISKAGSEAQVMALPSESEGHKTTLDDAEVIFSEVSSKRIGKAEKVKDCAYDYEFYRTEKVLTVKDLSSAAKKELGLKKGSVLRLVCDEGLVTPNDKTCE